VTAPAYTTRAQAAAPDAFLVRLMASAAWEAERFPGCSRRPFDETTPEWQAAACKAMAAAVVAAEATGYRVTAP
jgi:hypothetical protein